MISDLIDFVRQIPDLTTIENRRESTQRAIGEIRKLQEENAALKAERDWTAIDAADASTWPPFNERLEACRYDKGGFWVIRIDMFYDEYEIRNPHAESWTHWRPLGPLPAPPKEDAQ